MGRIGVEQLVSDSPGLEIAMIVDEQSESGHIGDIDVRFVALIVTNIDRECDEQRLVLKLTPRELVLTQELVCLQGER